jgi:hypothetical protein
MAEGAKEIRLDALLLGKAEGVVLGGSAAKPEAALLGNAEENFDTGVMPDGMGGVEIGLEAWLLGAAEEAIDGVMLGGTEGTEKKLLETIEEGNFDNGVLLAEAKAEGADTILEARLTASAEEGNGIMLDGAKGAEDGKLKGS